MTIIVGHRGADREAPENTIKSFQQAIDDGCQRTELDVRLSKDKKLIVIHDPEVSRVCDAKGYVKDKNLDELKQIHCQEGQKISTLQEVIDICKNKIDLQIELKEHGEAELVNKSVIENNIEDQVIISSFFPEVLVKIKKINPQLKTLLLFDELTKLEEGWRFAEQIPLDYIGLKGDIVTNGIVQQAHDMGIKVYAYHVNDLQLGKKLIEMNVDEIGTGKPKMFLSDF